MERQEGAVGTNESSVTATLISYRRLRRKLDISLMKLREVRDQGIRAVSEPSQMPYFKGMMRSLDKYMQETDHIWEQLSELNEEDGAETLLTKEDRDLYAKALRYFHEASGAAESFPTMSRVSCELNNTNFMEKSHVPRKSHPAIPIPKFDGDILKWRHFKDKFESLIVQDDNLTDIDRFHYLSGALEGAAEAIVENLPITSANFAIAWKTLNDTYDNPRIMASTYLDQFIEAKPIPSNASASSIRLLISQLTKAVSAFNTFQIADPLQFVFFHLAKRCLDKNTQDVFEWEHRDTLFPTFEQLIMFLKSRCEIQELNSGSRFNSEASTGMQAKVNNSRNNRFTVRPQGNKRFGLHPPLATCATSAVGQNNVVAHSSPGIPQPSPCPSSLEDPPCPVCRERHRTYSCEKFRAMPVDQRIAALKDWSGCRNCLRDGHVTKNCRSRWKCKYCRSRHHTLLHQQTNPTVTVATTQALEIPYERKHEKCTAESTKLSALLGTAVALVKGEQQESLMVRMVIDSASHVSFLTRRVAMELGIPIQSCSVEVSGIANTPIMGYKGVGTCTLISPKFPDAQYTTKMIIVDTLMTPQPPVALPRNMYEPYLHYELADPEFWKPREIDCLLGCDLFADILTGDLESVPNKSAKLLGTVFGFVVIGRVADIPECSDTLSSMLVYSQPILDSDLHLQLQRFWEIEEPTKATIMRREDQECEEYFKRTVSRSPTGRYIVNLSFRNDRPKPYGLRCAALRRLTHLEAKLEKHPKFRELYNAFMEEYLHLQHMEEATSTGSCLIPHHGVFKGSPLNSKLRVVFDASAPTSQGSLNEHLWTGPKLQNDLITILLNFRRHRYAFTMDIEKMYRQILVHPKDRLYQHILWRFDTSQAVREYELKTLSYGLACAPYLALRVIRQLIEDEGDKFPSAANALRHDMYVDDIATGAATIHEAKELLRQLVLLLNAGEFPLSKWASNCPQLLEDVVLTKPMHEPENDNTCRDLTPEDFIKILGLQWEQRQDVFSFKIDLPPPVLTKRGLLSTIAKIYDPLGFVGPVVIMLKILLQKSWLEKSDWDSSLSDDIRDQLQDVHKELPHLGTLRIPRLVLKGYCTHLLAFADASERAYCATIYLRTCSEEGANSMLLISKTKVAPVKHQSVPRLELCAALLTSNLMNSLQGFIHKLPSVTNILFFTDSKIVLGWLCKPHERMPTFVANRVARILETTDPQNWYHVRTDENPSDIGSRGMLPTLLTSSSLWFHGPKWILNDPRTWKLQRECEYSEVHYPTLMSVATTVSAEPLWMDKFSSYIRLVRVTAWMLRFAHNTKHSKRRWSKLLSLQEIREAEKACCMVVQHAHFGKNSDDPSRPIPKELKPLSPFKDEHGLLRVGGRLKNAPVPAASKHPILLPPKVHLSRLIVRHYHQSTLHPGPTLLTAIIRSKYWIIGLRNVSRQVCRECVVCRRAEAPTCQPKMGCLPSSRFNMGRAFLHMGLDFGGPFILRESLRRKAQTSKAYLCLAICLSTRAVHLEAVSSLSTTAFLAALDRIVGRRGLPAVIYSDNGTNFVGAANQLKALYRWLADEEVRDAVHSFAIGKGIDWQFIPPHAPHFGGLWEAGIKSAKRLLRSVYGEAQLTYEEFSTLLVKVEAAMNSRPLCPLSSDPNEIDYLSPAHFLIGSSLLSPPEPYLLDQRENYNQRWNMVNRMSQHFWQRWRKEYLSILQTRSKWQRPGVNLAVGDLVFVRDDRVPRLRWPRGRVINIHPGNDDIVRVATVQTNNAIYKRPVNHLVPLFVKDDSGSSKE